MHLENERIAHDAVRYLTKFCLNLWHNRSTDHRPWRCVMSKIIEAILYLAPARSKEASPLLTIILFCGCGLMLSLWAMVLGVSFPVAE